MATGSKVATKNQTGKKVISKKKGGEYEYRYSLALGGTEESLGDFEERHTKKGKWDKLRKKNAAYFAESGGVKGRKKGVRMTTPGSSSDGKETNVSYLGGEDSNWNYSDDEFDGDEELPVMKKKKKKNINRLRVQEAQLTEREKQKSRLKILERPTRKNPKKELLRENTKRGRGNDGGVGKLNVSSDSDSAASGSEFTISEEEREQIREAAEICKSLTTDLRPSYLKTIKEGKSMPSQTKCSESKDKEEMVDNDIKIKMGKQVCGICLSEEGKRTVRGILNCCSHYFCFACIIEWSKVESRCPICKQRFKTIRRTAKVVGKHGSKDVITPVPECDQVYQPSEEELRGYLDPFENVLCTECHQGGDDALMLLCDICDSSAHTYCVGLGCEVPEGNWYCVACRTVPASPNANALSTSHHGANNNLSVGSSPILSVQENSDLNQLNVPDTPYDQATLPSVSPINSAAATVSESRQLNQPNRPLTRINRSCDDEIAHLQAIPLNRTPQNILEQGRLPFHATPSMYGEEVLPPISMSWSSQVVHHQASASTSTRSRDCVRHQQFHPSNCISNTRGSCPQKELLQSMVRSHLKSLSTDTDLGYVGFKYIARRSTHTILAAFGLEHRRNEVCRVQARPSVCHHLHRGSVVAEQCSSCLGCFVRRVVREIMFINVPR